MYALTIWPKCRWTGRDAMHAGAVNEQETQWALRWRDAPWGQRDVVIEQAVAVLRKSKATLYRRFKQLVAIHTPRKRRADAGKTALTHDEALNIATLLKEHLRMNGQKHMVSMTDALNELRANGLIRAERIDKETGEVFLLSNSTIFRALRRYNLHPKQLSQPAPVMQLRSKHPNYVWQIDASRCVLYYLPRPGAKEESGLHIMEREKFNKNKPDNLIRAIRAGLWRYVITDHASGWIYVQYVLDGETAANLIDVFIGAMQQRAGQAMHGVPEVVMLDLGGANTSAAFTNVCQALGVRWWFNAKGNPRGKGQVEKSQDIVERKFESRLKTLPKHEVSTLAQINALAAQWMRTFSATAVHSRHGLTRDAAWLKILPEQLVRMPDAELLRLLAVSPAEKRKVNANMTVKFEGREWSVQHLPGVQNGETLFICRNAFDAHSVHAVGHDENGIQTFYVLPERLYNEWGQPVDAPMIGESYKRHADTPVQTNLKAIERRAMDADTDTEAAQKRKEAARFMGGRYDPFATARQQESRLPTPLPRRGQAHGLDAIQPLPVVEAPLPHIQAAKRLRGQFPEWGASHYQHMQSLYPGGVPESALDEAAAAIAAAMQPAHFPAATPAPRLRAVG